MGSADGARGPELSPEQAPVSCWVGVLLGTFQVNVIFFEQKLLIF